MVSINQPPNRPCRQPNLISQSLLLANLVVMLVLLARSLTREDVSYLLRGVDADESTANSAATSKQGSSACPEVAIKFAVHADALDQATQSGRGYKPKHERMSTWMPETIGSYWWLNDTIPESFSMAELDTTYDLEYFKEGGHPSGPEHVKTYTTYVHKYASMFFPPPAEVTSAVEFGNGGGYYAKKFVEMYGDNFVTVEGTGVGIGQTLARGIPTDQVVQHDLRYPIYLGRRFDLAICSEVVEHVEPPFASQIVLTLILHADVIWFSFKPAGGNHRAWINHPNERPLKMWENLFDFYGYDLVMLPNEVYRAVIARGNFLAYRRDSTTLKIPTQSMMDAAVAL